MTRPSLRELECLVAVAEHLNFSRAARQMHLSQPPLTRHIRALEEKLGSRLFERDTHSVSLTVAGRLYLEDARLVLAHLDRAGDAVRRARQGETERLRLAFVGALLDERLVRLIQRFRNLRPDCQVQVSDLSPAAQTAALESGQIDCGFIGAPPNVGTKEIGLVIWREEPLLLALPMRHSLARTRSLRWKDLRGLPWVMVSSDAAPAFRRQFSELVERHRLEPRIVQESDRVPAILTMVAAGSGMTMVPQSVAHLLSKGIAFRKLPAPRPVLQHTFAYRKDADSPALKVLLAALRKSKF